MEPQPSTIFSYHGSYVPTPPFAEENRRKKQSNTDIPTFETKIKTSEEQEAEKSFLPLMVMM
jgi:hypothetical protein